MDRLFRNPIFQFCTFPAFGAKLRLLLTDLPSLIFLQAFFSSEVARFPIILSPALGYWAGFSVWQASLRLQSWKIAKLEDLLFTCFGCRDFGCDFRNGAEPGQSRIFIILCN